ncbi:hypothetical protein ACVD4U_004299, partial [Vibrio vulnificus]
SPLNAALERLEVGMELPEEVKEKLDSIHSEVEEIVNLAYEKVVTEVSGKISFRYEVHGPRDVLTKFERAQSVCFVTRYDSLPIFEKISVEARDGRFYFANYLEARSVLNEYRAIIQNKNDSVHYQKIHKFCREKLLNTESSFDLCISVRNEDKVDISEVFARLLNEHYKAIKVIIKHCEFDYIYNGILQHSDHNYTERFWEEYSSGEANYIFIKHALLVGYIKDLLVKHHFLFNVLTFPKLGPL